MPLWGGIELGGTNIVCAYSEHPMAPLIDGKNRYEFRTTEDPNQCMAEISQFFRKAPQKLKSIGIASFGPLNYDAGEIGTTPKKGWKNFPIVSMFKQLISCAQVALETDVNAAALAESVYGAGRGTEHLVYATIGTGIAAGIISNGQLLRGSVHPELGHIGVQLHATDLKSGFKGCCKYHAGNNFICLEGLASGEAIKRRWNWTLFDEDSPHWKEAWEIEAYYLAQLVLMLTYAFCPNRIILGGGVIQNQPHLIDAVYTVYKDLLGGYFNYPYVTKRREDILVLPQLGDNSGVIGALQLAYLKVNTIS
jgi:fructokinase